MTEDELASCFTSQRRCRRRVGHVTLGRNSQSMPIKPSDSLSVQNKPDRRSRIHAILRKHRLHANIGPTHTVPSVTFAIHATCCWAASGTAQHITRAAGLALRANLSEFIVRATGLPLRSALPERSESLDLVTWKGQRRPHASLRLAVR